MGIDATKKWASEGYTLNGGYLSPKYVRWDASAGWVFHLYNVWHSKDGVAYQAFYVDSVCLEVEP